MKDRENIQDVASLKLDLKLQQLQKEVRYRDL